MSPCLSREQLRQLLAGELAGDVEQAINAHVETCSRCLQLLEESTAPSGPRAVPPAGAAPNRGTPPSSRSRQKLSDDQLHRLRYLLPPGPATAKEAAPAPAAADWPTVPGYEILRVLGRGGMAVVYEAHHSRLNRRVALKMILAGEQVTPEQLVRFYAEGEIVAGLRHPHIVQIYEVGAHHKQPYLALELMEGGNLARALGGKPLAARAAAELAETLARAMDYAHRQGVIHRDLNPANVLLSSAPGGLAREGSPAKPQATAVPKISDFGLAKNLDRDSRLTKTGFVMGTPSYMAPEQVRGEGERVGPVTDVYALGAILYELLTGRPPFQAPTSLEVMSQVTELDPVPPSRLIPQVPHDLEVICLKCLEKDPRQRYASAAALADDLRRYLNSEPIQARRVTTLGRAWRWAKRRPAVASLLLALCVTLLGGTVVSTYFAVVANQRAGLAQIKEQEATTAQARFAQQSAELLLDRGLELAGEGKVAEALHWMLASLQAAPDPDFQRLVRTHLASWAARVPTLSHWLDTPHRSSAFSPDGKRFVTAGKIGPEAGAERIHLQFWDVQDGQPLGGLIRTEDLDICSLAFSPDGKTLLAGNGSIQKYQYKPGWATRWDVAGGQPIGQSGGHTDCVLSAAWSPDGKHFVTGSRDGTVVAWDAAMGRQIGRPLKHPTEVRQLACSPDGRWVLARAVKTVHLWEIATGEPVGPPIQPGDGEVKSVAFSADGRTILVTGSHREEKGYSLLAQRWDPGTHRMLGPPHVASHPTGAIALLPDGRIVPAAAVSPDGRWFQQSTDGIQLWCLARPRCCSLEDHLLPPEGGRTVRPPLLPAHLSPAISRAWVPLGGMDRVQAWDTSTGQPAGVAVPQVPRFGRSRLEATADGRLIATVVPKPDAGLSEAVQVWQASTGRRVGPPLLQPNAVLAMAFSPDGKILATGGDFHRVHLWDVPTGKRLGEPLPPSDIILALAFSPDGQTLAVGTWGCEVRLWDVAGQRPARPPLKHDEQVYRVQFSPDGARLLATCRSAAHLWDARTGQKIATLKSARPAAGDRSWLDLQARISPDGKTLLTSSGSSSFRLWDAATGGPLGPPTPPGEVQLSCFAFSPDSRLVVAGHEDGTAQVWDVASSRPLGAPVVQPLAVTGVAFRPDSRSFLTVAADGTIRSWPVPVPLEGSVERIALSVQLSTGLRLDEGRSVVALTRPEWEKLRGRWCQREGPADWVVALPVPEADWHDARAHDAEQTGQSFTARWHLDRLIARRPNDTLLYVRRARTHTEEGQWGLAEADYHRALERGSLDELLTWYRSRAWACHSRQQWPAALWYLDRLLRARPDEEGLRRQRAEVHAQLDKARE